MSREPAGRHCPRISQRTRMMASREPADSRVAAAPGAWGTWAGARGGGSGSARSGAASAPRYCRGSRVSRAPPTTITQLAQIGARVAPWTLSPRCTTTFPPYNFSTRRQCAAWPWTHRTLELRLTREAQLAAGCPRARSTAPTYGPGAPPGTDCQTWHRSHRMPCSES